MGIEAAHPAQQGASWFYLLRHTPLRDVVRGRLTGRVDIEAVIAASELPKPLGELVRRVVRRTRLSRLEKVDVARELAAHFQDGIGAGAPAHELACSFGDPRRVAKLIRRAKRRNRARAWKALDFAGRTFLAFFAAAFLVYIGLTIRLYSGEPRLSRNYVAELNAPVLATPQQDRAWPLYRQAYLATSKFPDYDNLKPSDENWVELAAFAEQNLEALRLYRAAGQKPHLGRIHDLSGDLELAYRHSSEAPEPDSTPASAEEQNPPFIGIMLPEVSVFRDAARLLRIDAHIAAQSGDADRAYTNIEAIFRIVEHSSETPMLISDLVAIAILRLNVDTIGTILRDQAELFSDRQLVQFSHRLAGIRGGGPLRVGLIGERWLFEDIVQRLYTDDGQGNGHLAADSPNMLASFSAGGQSLFSALFSEMTAGFRGRLFAPALTALVADRREMLARHDELMDESEAEAALPLWQRGRSIVDREIVRMRESPIERIRYLPIVIMMPSLSRALVIAERGTQERDATLAALACELYRRRTGHWPASLAELAPRYLPAVPLDRFDGQPLRYRVADGCAVIYSVGWDRDDDGGRVPQGARGNRRARQWQPERVVEGLKAAGSLDLPDGDWVLWPPVD